MSASLRESLRTKVLNQKPQVRTVALEDGVEVEVRQPTAGQMLDSIGEQDLKKRMAKLLIDSCFVPGTGEQLFNETDAEVLMTIPSGGYYQKLIDAVNDSMSSEAAVVKP